MELQRFFLALCIPEVGRKTAKILAKYVTKKIHETNCSFKEVLSSWNYEELIVIRDIWPVGASEIVEFFDENQGMMQRLLEEVHPIIPEQNVWVWVISQNENIFGKSFCVTGSFEWVSRDQIHERIESLGGEIRTSVSPKLDYLIVGSDAGSKLEKANTLGVKILSLGEFESLISV